MKTAKRSAELNDLFASEFALLAPPPQMTLSEWADRYAVIPAGTGAEPGRWSTYTYQRDIQDAMWDREHEVVVVMKSARIGYTKMLGNLIGATIHLDPCNILMVQPTIDDAEGYAKDEIDPYFRETDVLRGLVAEEKSRQSGNTLKRKRFKGGHLILNGANAPTGFRRITMKKVLFDEVDGYPPVAGREGDQIRLGMRRAETFWDRKYVIGSTPTVSGESRIEDWFLRTDQRRYFVPCPFCGEMQYLKFRPNLVWEEGKPHTARYRCEHCEELISAESKQWMMERGEWRPTAEGEPGYIGFHISALYSPHPRTTWGALAAEFLAVKDRQEELKTFINTVLGEVWIEKGDAPDWKIVYERREQYKTGVIPHGGLTLTAFADVQKDRLEVEVVAWGRNMESWSVDYRVIPGEPESESDECWAKLSAMLSEAFPHSDGGSMMIERLGIDSGYATMKVYTWARKQDKARVFVTKGQEHGTNIVPLQKEVDIQDKKKGKRIYRGLKVWMVATSLAKGEFYGWLRQARDPEAESLPYGWCHFPEYDAEYFQQLTAETSIREKDRRGYYKHVWKKTRERNEALDCRIGNRAMAFLLGIDRWTEEKWTAREQETRIVRTIGTAQRRPAVRRERKRDDFWG